MDEIIDILPEGIALQSEVLAVGLLVLGFLIALAVRFLLGRLAVKAISSETGFISLLAPFFERATPLFFWGVLIVTIILVFRFLGIETQWEFVGTITAFLPRVVIAFAIIGLGHLAGLTLRDIVRASVRTAELARPISSAVYAVVMGLGTIIGIQHVGINVSYVAVFLLVVITAILAALGLAFALGAKDHIANLIARRDLQIYSAGDRIRIDKIEGTVVEITKTTIILNTKEGQAVVPASLAASSTILRLAEET